MDNWEGVETAHIVGFSGGIDSQAVARWVINRFNGQPGCKVILMNSNAGGNEHPMTDEFIQQYSQRVFPVECVNAIVGDMGGRAKKKREQLGWDDDMPMDFADMAILKGRFPSSQAQFCTEHLKLQPQRRWCMENIPISVERIRYTGIRHDESRRRVNRPYKMWDDFFDCELVNPIADWTKKMCFDYCEGHDGFYNPLYKLGFNRVGCAPCINSGKDDVLLWHDRFPEMIDKVREWEKRVGRAFFAPMVPGMEINWVDDVVEWAKTARGGTQFDIFRSSGNRPSCESKYGLCDTE